MLLSGAAVPVKTAISQGGDAVFRFSGRTASGISK